MEAWIIWLIIAAVLIIVEVLSQMIWTFCLAIGSVCALAASLVGVDAVWQIIILGIVSVLAYFLFVPVFNRWKARSDKKDGKESRTGMDALLGRRAVVTHEINPGMLGRVRIDGDSWQVRAPKSEVVIPSGTEVVVTGYDSIILTVEPLK